MTIMGWWKRGRRVKHESDELTGCDHEAIERAKQEMREREARVLALRQEARWLALKR